MARSREVINGMRALNGGSTANLEIAPNLWAGCRPRAGRHVHRAGRQPSRGRRPHYRVPHSGIEEFILFGYPHLEEAWWFGEGVLPLLRRRGLWTRPDLADQRTSRTAAYAALHGS